MEVWNIGMQICIFGPVGLGSCRHHGHRAVGKRTSGASVETAFAPSHRNTRRKCLARAEVVSGRQRSMEEVATGRSPCGTQSPVPDFPPDRNFGDSEMVPCFESICCHGYYQPKLLDKIVAMSYQNLLC